jgi:putative FmdB family regulatory protein
MLIYEYICENCGEEFERFRAVQGDAEEAECPRCESEGVERVISTVFGSTSSCDSYGPTFPT